MQHHLPLRNKLIIMFSVMASLFLVALDQTIISTALSTIVDEFNAYSSLSWIVTAYLLTTTVTVPIAGKLSDMYGRKILLLIGVGIFGAASLMSGLAGDVNQLILWRAVQGIGGGIITANAFTIIGDLFAARERGKWQGLFGAVFGRMEHRAVMDIVLLGEMRGGRVHHCGEQGRAAAPRDQYFGRSVCRPHLTRKAGDGLHRAADLAGQRRAEPV